MDKVIEEEKEFIQNFALELTNRTLNQREEIGKKYYKQLKRLQAENFELKESLKVFQRLDITKILTLYKVGDIELLEQKCDRLQAENDNLKDDIDKQQLYVDSLEQENEQLKKLKFKSDGIELLQDANLNLHNANVKYRQALQEIREIARNEIETRILFADEKSFCDFNNILAKINEVIGAE